MKNSEEHPSLLRARKLTAECGSRARTLRGIVRYLRNSRPAAVIHGGLRRLQLGETFQPWRAMKGTRKAWKSRAARWDQWDRQAKRARADLVFRREFAKTLRCHEQAALRYPCSLDGITQRADSHKTRRRTLTMIEILRIFAGIRSKTTDLGKFTPPPGVAKVPMSEKLARKLGAAISMKGKDAIFETCFGSSHGHHRNAVPSTQNGRGQWVGYERAVHENYVRSFAIIQSNPRTIHYAGHDQTRKITLPEGYRWDIDANGLRVFCVTARTVDYHPDAADLLNPNAADALVLCLETNRERRQKMAAEKAATIAEMEGVWVCLADSLRAGNCQAGSEQFAARHHIDTTRHYHAPELLAMANGDAGRVRLAITAARLRHQRELAQGFALLSEHSV